MYKDQWVFEVDLNPNDPNTIRYDLWPVVVEAKPSDHIRVRLNGTPGSAALRCNWRRDDIQFQFVCDSARTRSDWEQTLFYIDKIRGDDFA